MPTPSVNTADSNNPFTEYTLAFAVCLIVSALAVLPFFRIGEVPNSGCCGGAMPVTHDMGMHLNQMQSFYQGLAAGSLYPRWDAQTNRGFGSPTTIFYPPLTYYITSILYLITGSWMVVMVLFYLLAMIASGMAFFALARSRFSTFPALLASALYLVMPYHLLNHYQRGALAECLSFVFIPLMALALLRLTSKDLTRRGVLRWVPALSLMWGLFIWSHPPTAYQFWLIAFPVLLVASVAMKRWRGLLWIGSAIVVGTMISAAYLLPAVVEENAVHSDDIARSWPYQESYVLNFSSTRYDHIHDEFVVRVDWIWISTTILLCAVGLLLTFSRPGESAVNVSGDFRIWLSASLLATFMMLPVSSAISSMIPRVEIGVFAWRMLALTSAGLSLLVGYLSAIAFSIRTGSDSMTPRRALRIAVFACCAVVVILSFVYVVYPMYRAEAFKPIPEHSNYSLVPLAGRREQPNRPEVSVLEERGTASIKLWEPEHRVIDVNMIEQGIVSLRLFNYPGWTARDGGVEIPVRTGPSGEVEVELAAGQRSLVMEFRNTWTRNLGMIVSVFALMLTACMFAFSARAPVARADDKWEAG